jgi:transcriptional regulator with XRE-family HTH domain
MRSSVQDILPVAVRRGLTKLGHDLTVARKKRRLTVAMMAERLGVGKTTYLRAERGHPTVALGVYAMALFVLGFGDVWSGLIDPQKDEQGLLLEERRLPQRVRTKKTPTAS